jgi:2-amino-4-hydroxy-6-hydroxymethyldihydropteridine diphosphokinase
VLYHLSLGSNIGDRSAHLAQAVRLLGDHEVKINRISSIYRTEPVGHIRQAWFYNQALETDSCLNPWSFLKMAKEIEKEMGRTSPVSQGPRIIDIDILLAGDIILNSPELTVPHSGLALRKFVLVPLREIAPDVTHPLLNKTISELADDCPDRAAVIRLG